MSEDKAQRSVAGSIIKAPGGPFTLTNNVLERQSSRDVKFIRSALSLAQIWSKDPSSKVCAIAVGETNNLVAFGYNGFPPGIADTSERLNDRDKKLKLTIHAEINALSNAWFPVKTLYVTHCPCSSCAIRIIGERTVYRVVYCYNDEYQRRWADSIIETKAYFLEAQIILDEIVLSGDL